MTKTQSKDVPLSDIRIDGGTQPRAEINQDVVADYKVAFEIGADFPPAEVYYDGTDYWLADGFHRFHAARQSKQETLDCRVHSGTLREAILFSVGANAIHGLRRSNADKRKAVLVLLNDDEWGKWSAREIAERCGVSHTFVNETRQTTETASIVSGVKFKTSTGKTSTRAVKPRDEQKPEPPKANGVASDPEADRRESIMASQKTTPAPASQFDPEELEAKAKSLVVDTTKPLAERITQQNKMLESFCRLLVKTFEDNLPTDPWLDEGQVEIARSQLKSCCGAIRVAKAYEKPCPKCHGKGCKTCRKCGYLPKMSYEMMGGK